MRPASRDTRPAFLLVERDKGAKHVELDLRHLHPRAWWRFIRRRMIYTPVCGLVAQYSATCDSVATPLLRSAPWRRADSLGPSSLSLARIEVRHPHLETYKRNTILTLNNHWKRVRQRVMLHLFCATHVELRLATKACGVCMKCLKHSPQSSGSWQEAKPAMQVCNIKSHRYGMNKCNGDCKSQNTISLFAPKSVFISANKSCDKKKAFKSGCYCYDKSLCMLNYAKLTLILR